MIEKNNTSKAYLVGGGIASLSAAVYLIKDGHIKGNNIYIFDESKKMGGSLDAQNLASLGGYVMRGVRIFEEEAFTCTFDLMSKIPSLTSPDKTLRQEFVQFNKKNRVRLKSRLVKSGKAIDSRPLGLKLEDRIKLFSLLFRQESSLEHMEIRDFFSPSFFKSNFWFEFCTIFAFQPWHSLIEFKKYLVRFFQDLPNIDTLKTMEITPRNQYESLVLPIINWLEQHGVNIETETKIINLGFDLDGKTVNRIDRIHNEIKDEIVVRENDYVFATLGSITANSSIGSMTESPSPNHTHKDASWTLWENISRERPEFGNPHVFNSNTDKSKWISFTITLRDPIFFKLMQKFIDKKVNAYGGINLIDSNWLISIVLSFSPYFSNQPDDVMICWGYGLFPDEKGNFINKKMSECNGEEILTELISHLRFNEHMDTIIENAVCIPCSMPYITSQFLPRKLKDRPAIVPKGSTNLAFLGQYCEIPDDVVFTTEYSIRSAQTAVYSLLKLKKKVSPIYKGTHHAKVVYDVLKAAFR